jgi:hypothetical protein
VLAWPAMSAATDTAAAAGRPWAQNAALAAAGAIVAGAVFFGGGSGTGSVMTLGGLAVAAAALAAVAASLGLLAVPSLDAPGRVGAAAGCALVAWGGISIAWSIAGDRSWDALNKGLVYAAFGLVGLVLAGRGHRAVRDVALVLAVVLGAALAWALVGKAVPSLFPEGDRVARLRNPVGHPNGLALLADAAIPLGLWLATAARGRVARPGGVLLVYAAVLAIMLTQSRSGLLAGLAVTALWLWLSPERVEGALLGGLAAAPALVVAGWAFTRPALVEDGAARADRVADGRVFALLTLAAAVVALALALRLPVARLVATKRRQIVRALFGGAALVGVVGVVGLVVAVGNPFTWAADQVSGDAGSEVANDPSRFGTLNTNNRIAWWGEAWDVFRASPGGGSGANTFELARKPYRADARTVSQPHNVPLQLLAGTGLVGLALGATFAGALGVAVSRSTRRLAGGERSAALALLALPVAWALHALVDYDLDFIALSGPALLVAWVLAGAGRPPASVPRGWLPVTAACVSAVTLVAALAAPDLATRGVDAAYRALDAGDVATARDRSRAARELNPLSPDPLWALADIESTAGDDRSAIAYLNEATRLQPENPDTWYQLGLTYQLALGDQCRAYYALNQAYTLDPRSQNWVEGGALDIARDAVNDPVKPACGRGS